MGHRHLYGPSQMFENEQDQNWNNMHAEQPYMHLAPTSAAENGSLLYPVENMAIDGVHYPSPWNPGTRSNGYSSSSHNVEAPHYRPDVPGPSHDTFLHPSAAGGFCITTENFAHHASSSSYERPTFHGIEGGFVDHSMASGRGPYKRKSPGIPAVCERGNTSRYFCGGSSSDISISPDSRQDKPNTDCQHPFWDPSMALSYRANALSIGGGEGSMRNVRSRSALDLDSNLARPHFANNPLHHPYTSSLSINPPNSADISSSSSAALAREWNQVHVPHVHGIAPVSETTGLSHEASRLLGGTSVGNAVIDMGGYQHDFTSSRNPVIHHNLHGASSSQGVRGVRSSYSQRSTPTFRPASSDMRVGQFGVADEGLQVVAENYSSRPPSRSLPIAGWRNGERNGRSRISHERYRSISNDSGGRDRLAAEAFMYVDRASLYGPRNLLDRHRDMRLDIDNMSYEELLALGERIGSVSTGVHEDLVSRCLTQTLYCSTEHTQEERRCAICLEEYENMDDVGTLKICGHDYHAGCITKWLSMKNACPICKAAALPDNMKEE